MPSRTGLFSFFSVEIAFRTSDPNTVVTSEEVPKLASPSRLIVCFISEWFEYNSFSKFLFVFYLSLDRFYLIVIQYFPLVSLLNLNFCDAELLILVRSFSHPFVINFKQVFLAQQIRFCFNRWFLFFLLEKVIFSSMLLKNVQCEIIIWKITFLFEPPFQST